jgi:hypothetical protein
MSITFVNEGQGAGRGNGNRILIRTRVNARRLWGTIPRWNHVALF